MAAASSAKHANEQARLRNKLNLDVQSSAGRFADHDQDGNLSLDFEEFYAMQPKNIRDSHSSEAIRAWFDAADTDGNGTLSIDEFFVWSLSNAATKFGSASIEARPELIPCPCYPPCLACCVLTHAATLRRPPSKSTTRTAPGG